MTKKTWKKIGSVAANVLLVIFLVLCVFSVMVTLLSKRDADGATTLWGHQMRIIISESMAKCDATDVSDFKIKSIPLRSMIFIELVPEDPQEADEWYADLKEGDVLTFRYYYTSQETITHRIISIQPVASGGYKIELMGDNQLAGTQQGIQTIYTADTDSFNYVLGKVTGQSYPLGFLISLLKEPVGIVLIIIVPCAIIILLQVLKLVSLFTADKKKKQAEEAAKKDSELEELRRRLAQLEQNAPAQTETGSEKDPPAETEPTSTPSDDEKVDDTHTD